MKNTAVVCQAAGGAKPPRSVASMPPAKLGINLQTLVIFLINLRFPHLFLFTSLLMGIVWSLQSYTIVRAPAIVEEDEALYLFQSLLKRIKTPFLTVNALALDDAVHTLCKRIVRGFVVLCHGDLDAMLLHESVATQYVQERITTRHPARVEHHAEHRPELHPSDARIKPLKEI